ncbi:MAG: toprim domain-containing protein [Candidatus Gracilibacteria bacterium]
MNSAQAKNILIIDLLSHLGFEPIKIDNSDYWYSSPLHEDKTSSFKVNAIKNIWIDYGIPATEETKTFLGGRTLDLVMNIYNLQVNEALQKLSSIFNYSDVAGSSSSFHQQGIKQKINQIQAFAKSQNSSAAKSHLNQRGVSHNKDQGQSHSKLIKVISLEHKALFEYIAKRGIKSDIAVHYLREVHYSISSKDGIKKYFSLGFENDAGNYELRNAYSKGCIGSKDITTIKGTGNKELSIFEGFMDFLSALTHFKIDKFKSDVIILNSVSNKAKISDLLYSDLYNKIYLFLDNDKAGEDTQREFYSMNDKCVNCSNVYAGHKDFNEFLNVGAYYNFNSRIFRMSKTKYNKTYKSRKFKSRI